MNSTAIDSLFQVTPRYLRSANLERDYRDAKALNNYVLTPHAQDCLGRLAMGLRPASTQRAWRVTGNYGSGKSSFALFLARWFGGEATQLSRALDTNVRYDRFAVTSKPAYLPLLVTGSREPMGVALLRSLARLLGEQYSRGARSTLLRSLEAAVAAPFVRDEDVIAFVQAANQKLIKDRKCTGLLLLVDELGKFLEYAAFHSESQDIYLLQRLAECAATSGQSAPLFIVGLLHQGFNAYAENLDPLAQREWEKVAGRFEEVLFHQPLEEISELIAAALRVRTSALPKFARDEAVLGLKTAFEAGLFGRSLSMKTLGDLGARLYPLHGTLVPVVVRTFGRFGQNERSLFSFLLSDDPFSLASFARQPIAPGTTYRVHHFYDYVRANFGYRLAQQSYRSHWTQIESMVESFATSDAVELAVVKAVGILNLLDHPDLLATERVIVACLSGPGAFGSEAVTKAVARLHKSRRVLFQRGMAGAFSLWPHTSVDLEAAYERATRAIGSVKSVGRVIEEFLEPRPLVARRHYIETGNLRYADVRYVPVDQITSALNENSSADGKIIVALCETKPDCARVEKLVLGEAFQARPEVMVAIPAEPLSNQAGLVAEAMRWEWVVRNTPELEADRFAREEVSRQRQHARERLETRIEDLIGIRSLGGAQSLRWFANGQPLALQSGRQLLEALSTLFDRLYPKAPRVKNELLNRHSLSSAAAAARMRLIEGILTCSAQPLLGMDPTKKPPEMSMYLSVLDHGGIHQQSDGAWRLTVPGKGRDPLRVEPSFRAIHSFIEKRPDERIRVSDLLSALSQPPYGVRAGLSPVILAVYAAIHVQELAFYEDGSFLRELGGDEFLRLTKAPQNFEVQLCRVAGLRHDVFSSLLRVLGLNPSGRTEPHILDVVKPLCAFLAEVPDYIRTTRRLTPEAVRVRAAILAAREPVTLLFHELPKACGLEPFPVDSPAAPERARVFAKRLKGYLDELRGAFEALLDRLRESVRREFEIVGPFASVRRTLAERADAVGMLAKEPRVRAMCLRLSDQVLNEAAWLESLGSLLASQPPTRWTDTEEDVFARELHSMATRVKNLESIAFQSGGHESFAEAFHVALTKSDGSETQRVVFVDQDRLPDVKILAGEIEDLVARRGTVGMAALSQAAWTTMRKG